MLTRPCGFQPASPASGDSTGGASTHDSGIGNGCSASAESLLVGTLLEFAAFERQRKYFLASFGTAGARTHFDDEKQCVREPGGRSVVRRLQVADSGLDDVHAGEGGRTRSARRHAKTTMNGAEKNY